MYYVIKYSGPFGYIKPWTAVRDGETYSQQFLTPSIIKGIELKLFPELLREPLSMGEVQKIRRYKLTYDKLDVQQEQTRAKEFKRTTTKTGIVKINTSILKRGIMINPVLKLAFSYGEDAERAIHQHICLVRNEDILISDSNMKEIKEEDFNLLDGFELRFEKTEQSFLVGFNRFNNAEPMYGWLDIVGKPIRNG